MLKTMIDVIGQEMIELLASYAANSQKYESIPNRRFKYKRSSSNKKKRILLHKIKTLLTH